MASDLQLFLSDFTDFPTFPTPPSVTIFLLFFHQTEIYSNFTTIVIATDGMRLFER
jgi:hypothetical protein